MKKEKDMSIVFILLVMLLGIILLALPQLLETKTVPAANNPIEKPVVKGANLKIMTTNELLYFMILDISKGKNTVEYMFNDEASQWNYEYSDDSLKNISTKDLFIFSGAEFEPWISEYIDKLNKNNVTTLDISRGTQILNYVSNVTYNNRIIKYNPYYWMNEDNYKTALHNITLELQESDPVNRTFYSDNFNSYIKSLETYDNNFKAIYGYLDDYTFVVATDKLDYYLKYNKIQSIKVPPIADTDIKNINTFITDVKDSIKSTKAAYFLYSDTTELTTYRDLISQYKLIPLNLIQYKRSYDYLDILNFNLSKLTAAVSPKE